jgi:hypothetical protein
VLDGRPGLARGQTVDNELLLEAHEMKKVQWRKGRVGLLVLCSLLMGRTVTAATGDVQDVNQLKAELQAQRQRQAELEDKINQLEARQKLRERTLNEKIEQAVATEKKEEEKEEKKEGVIPEVLQWASKLRWYGDLRYRYEYIDDESKTTDRHRNRIRARLGLDAKVSDEWNLGFRLATAEGEDEGDPISTNQTLGGAFGKKPIWVDLAYLGYHPQWLKGLNVFAGKIAFPFYRVGSNQLIWDSDLTPEGGALLYGLPLGEKTSVNLSAGGFWVVERSSAEDTWLLGAQGYLKHQLNQPTYLLGGAGGYWYSHLQGEPALSLEWESPTSNFFGNSNAGGVYTSDYDLVEAFVEAGTEVAGMPVAVFGDWVKNTAAVDKSEDSGWLVGTIINKAKKPGSWQFEYNYRDLGRDAVVGQFNDSDFIGGGTGGQGHLFSATYVLANNVATTLTYFADRYDGRNGNAEYDRLQADILLKF